MKRAVIVHCWDGYPEYCWYPYIKAGLESRGYQVYIPFFPDLLPLLGKWIEKLTKAIGTPDDELALIGHSLGCVTILKYLESLPEGLRVGPVFLVAAFVNDLGYKNIANFFQKPLNFEKIKSHSDNFYVFQSTNDPYVQPYHAKILEENLGAEVKYLEKEHFTETKKDKKQYLALPELLEIFDRPPKPVSEKIPFRDILVMKSMKFRPI